MALAERSEGLCLLKKLSHLDLTSFSRMRVDLAAEVRNLNIFNMHHNLFVSLM